MKPPTALTIRLLFEDTSAQMIEGWQALAKKWITFVFEGCQTQAIRFEPALDKDLKWAAKPVNWMSGNPRDHRRLVTLRRFLANSILEKKTAVFFHFDGDTAFSQKHNEGSNEERAYKKGLLPHVFELLRGALKKENISSEEEEKKILRRLIPLIPYYSLEAWLYQNHQEVRRIVEEEKASEEEKSSLRRWQEAPEMLDEITQIKEKVFLKDLHNGRLAKSEIPLRSLYDLKKSFYESTLRIKECGDIPLWLGMIPSGSSREPEFRRFEIAETRLAQEAALILQAAYREEAKLLQVSEADFPPLLRGFQELQTSGHLFYGAFEGESMRGVLEIEKIDAQGSVTLDIWSLGVRPEHTRQGIGRGLLEAAFEAEVWHKTIVSTGAANEPAIRLYEKCGFALAGEDVKGGIPLVLFQKKKAHEEKTSF